MNCPRCQSTLTRSTISQPDYILVIDTCPSCGGSWFDPKELRPLEEVIEPTILEIRHIPSPADQFKEMNCPCCSHQPMMLKAEHERDHKVVIDYCPDCKGIWLDEGELEAIQKENWILTIGRVFKFLIGKDHMLDHKN